VITPVNSDFVLPQFYPEPEISGMRKPKTRLTPLGVERLKAPKTGRLEILDAVLPGFGLRVGATDARSYFVMAMVGSGPVVRNEAGEIIAGRRLRRFTVGDAKVISLDEARDKARDILRRVDAGEDPAQPKVIMPTFRVFAADFLQRHKSGIRASTHTERIRMLGMMNRWDHLQLDAIRPQDVVAFLDDTVARGAPVYANRMLSVLKTMFNDAMRRGVLDANPVGMVKKPTKEHPRERSLTDTEVGWLWQAAGAMDWPWGDFMRILLLSGQRRAQVQMLEWPEVDMANRVWRNPAAKMKSARPYEIALSELMVEVLEHARDAARQRGMLDERGLVFHIDGKPLTGFAQAKCKLDVAMEEIAGEPVKQWTIHDLRRTLVYHLASMNVAPHICDKLLDHASGVISGVSAIYNRFQYIDERRDALNAWGNKVAEIIGRRPAILAVLAAKR
jgi:integrase